MILRKYIRNSRGHHKGVVVALKYNNELRVGSSLCCKKDKYDKQVGFGLAVARAIENKPGPKSLERELHFIKERGKRYFKDLLENRSVRLD